MRLPTRTSWTFLLAVLDIGFLPSALEANGPPIHGDTAFVVGIEGAGIRGIYQERRFSKLLQNGKKTADPQAREMTIRMVGFMLPYETIPNRLLVGFTMPYLDKRLEMTTSGGERRAITNRGLGDLTSFAKYQFYQKDRTGETTRMSGKVGLKLPTGKDDARDETGALLSPSFQVGTGSWDVFGGVVLTHLYQRWGTNTNVVYQRNNEAKGFKHGDVFRYDLSGAMRLLPFVYKEYPSPQLNLITEFNGTVAAKRQDRGAPDPNSGGHTLLFSPGFQFIGGRDWLVDVSHQVPLVQNLNGAQLGLDRTWTAGFLVYLRK